MKMNRVRLLWFGVALLLFFTAPAFAAGIRVVRLSLAQGDVQIDRNAGDGWEQAINNMPVIGGARIYAAENSKAELEFEDGSNVRLAGPAQISILQLSTNPDGGPVNVIQVDSGLVYINARLKHHDDFRVSAATGEKFAITRPSHVRINVDQQVASISVSDGEVIAQAGNSAIHKGQTYNYVLGQPASAARQENVPPEPEDAWNQQRDNYQDQYASAGAEYSGSEDQSAPGVADLGAYGTYADIPGYGEMWQPYGVGADWDPYGYGAWSYYPTWGWTFVSAYPWGWAPYYYGSWCYIGGRGWWWRPGRLHGPHGSFGWGGGWHAHPRWAGSPGRSWNAPHAPGSHIGRGTVAVSGSHLPVGAIGLTHAPGAAHGGVGGTVFHGSLPRNSALHGPSEAVSGPSGVVRGPSGALGMASRGGSPSIVGRPGDYRVMGNNNYGRNGFEIHRPPAGYTPRASTGYADRSFGGASVTPRYGYTGGASSYRGYGYSGAAAVPHASMPASAPAVRGPSMSAAPHVSSGAGGYSGGGFHGGGGASSGGGFHGGGFGGGGFHGGGGGGHR